MRSEAPVPTRSHGDLAGTVVMLESEDRPSRAVRAQKISDERSRNGVELRKSIHLCTVV